MVTPDSTPIPKGAPLRHRARRFTGPDAARRIVSLVAALLLLPAPPGISGDSGNVHARDAAKQRIDREWRFLLSSSDEINRALASAKGTQELLRDRAGEAAGGCVRCTVDAALLLEWYRNYTAWLSAAAAELEDYAGCFHAKQKASPGWTLRYAVLKEKCRSFAYELNKRVERLKREKREFESLMLKVRKTVDAGTVRVTRYDQDVARELWPEYKLPADYVEPIDIPLTHEEIRFLKKLWSDLDEQQKYLESLTELGSYEHIWQNSKSKDFTLLSEIAEALDRGDPRGIAEMIGKAISAREADAESFRRRSREIGERLETVASTGTLERLDRLEDLFRYYRNMQSRYDDHVEWLGGQIGSYRADLVEMSKDL